jgi:phenylacetate-CoA ligase
LGPHYFIELSKKGNLDVIDVHVELAGGANTGGKKEAAAALRHRIKSYIGVSAGIEVHDMGGIPRSEGKAQRVIDKRGE